MAHVLGSTGSDGLHPIRRDCFAKLNHDFWNTEGIFHPMKYKDNSYHPEPDVMAAVPLLYAR
jgi:hypothetical protein